MPVLPPRRAVEKRPVPFGCDGLVRDSPLEPRGVVISTHTQGSFFTLTENAGPKPLLGTALTLPSSALSRGDGQRTALGGTTRTAVEAALLPSSATVWLTT